MSDPESFEFWSRWLPLPSRRLGTTAYRSGRLRVVHCLLLQSMQDHLASIGPLAASNTPAAHSLGSFSLCCPCPPKYECPRHPPMRQVPDRLPTGPRTASPLAAGTRSTEHGARPLPPTRSMFEDVRALRHGSGREPQSRRPGRRPAAFRTIKLYYYGRGQLAGQAQSLLLRRRAGAPSRPRGQALRLILCYGNTKPFRRTRQLSSFWCRSTS